MPEASMSASLAAPIAAAKASSPPLPRRSGYGCPVAAHSHCAAVAALRTLKRRLGEPAGERGSASSSERRVRRGERARVARARSARGHRAWVLQWWVRALRLAGGAMGQKQRVVSGRGVGGRWDARCAACPPCGQAPPRPRRSLSPPPPRAPHLSGMVCMGLQHARAPFPARLCAARGAGGCVGGCSVGGGQGGRAHCRLRSARATFAAAGAAPVGHSIDGRAAHARSFLSRACAAPGVDGCAGRWACGESGSSCGERACRRGRCKGCGGRPTAPGTAAKRCGAAHGRNRPPLLTGQARRFAGGGGGEGSSGAGGGEGGGGAGGGGSGGRGRAAVRAAAARVLARAATERAAVRRAQRGRL